MKITLSGTAKKTTTGAFLIQNSWSTDWGKEGFGWSPYEYVNAGLGADFWTLINAEWPNLSNAQLGLDDRPDNNA